MNRNGRQLQDVLIERGFSAIRDLAIMDDMLLTEDEDFDEGDTDGESLSQTSLWALTRKRLRMTVSQVARDLECRDGQVVPVLLSQPGRTQR